LFGKKPKIIQRIGELSVIPIQSRDELIVDSSTINTITESNTPAHTLCKDGLLQKLQHIIDSEYTEDKDRIKAIETSARIMGLVGIAKAPQKVLNTQNNTNNTVIIEAKESGELPTGAGQVDILGIDSSMRLQQAFQLHLAKERMKKEGKN
jgi:hypothetical protein